MSHRLEYRATWPDGHTMAIHLEVPWNEGSGFIPPPDIQFWVAPDVWVFSLVGEAES